MELAEHPCWDQAFAVEVPLSLTSKSNYRRQRSGRNWRDHQAFELVVRARLRQALPEGWELGDADAKVIERPSVVMAVLGQTLYDSGNTPKGVADAAQGVVVHTDASIDATVAITRRGAGDGRFTLAFARLPAGSDLAAKAAAAAELAVRAAAFHEGRLAP
ncbi:hypothetical protein [Bailinhaonella thermotolerans]|uniref:Uncharacterized protein n=1 Tax=Bailinhaonella thermotolerans TaxID=1070861 RepID=A0A3A4ABS5_9ACTN|nr:hypothetical protein [Bailinhaonella thermotolerans]RJL23944.1 hypothetical protein D5H75_31395 [Bailinhaonella thermotolerans]